MQEKMLESKAFMIQLGKDMKKARQEKGITQTDVACKMQLAGYDVDRFRIGRLENAERLITAPELFVLALILGLDLNFYKQVCTVSFKIA